MLHTAREKENYFVFLAKCYKSNLKDDIIYEEKQDGLWDYDMQNQAYIFVGDYSTYDDFKPQNVMNLYLNKYPKTKIYNTEVFIVLSDSQTDKNVRLIYFSHDTNSWETIYSDNEELKEWNIITDAQSDVLYQNFANYINDYNNNKPNSVLEKKYLTYPIKIGN